MLVTLASGACWPLHAQTAAALPARVVASFSILADMARELAPAGTEVLSLVRPDADAHVFEPRPADGKRLAQAELVLVNGLGFEGWIDRLVKVSGFKGRLVVASQGVVVRGAPHAQHGHGHRHGQGAVDPHAWQDLAHARLYIANLSAAFAQRWPAQQAEIDARRLDYLARVDTLERRVRQQLDAIPRQQRRVITSHDAFGYFGAAYGIDFLAPQGWATHSEPSAAAVAKLIRQIRQQGVKALFVENISDPRLLQRIAQEGGAKIGGTLYSDALSAAGGPAATYLKMIEHNARTLSQALTG
ncbi:MAG: zinc ABC transporter substrate-binding protein [Rubrivivax sp.]|nr:zinc ABC transporter substrate-binding protein [Rubrivivax sp.]